MLYFLFSLLFICSPLSPSISPTPSFRPSLPSVHHFFSNLYILQLNHQRLHHHHHHNCRDIYHTTTTITTADPWMRGDRATEVWLWWWRYCSPKFNCNQLKSELLF